MGADRKHGLRKVWSLGMSLCRYCVQDNVVSHRVLFEEYGLALDKPIRYYDEFLKDSSWPISTPFRPTVLDGCRGKVWFISDVSTATARREFTINPVDFRAKYTQTIFFWRPHLETIFELGQMRFLAQKRHEVSTVLQAAIRRKLLRTSFVRNKRRGNLRPYWENLCRIQNKPMKTELHRVLQGRGQEVHRSNLMCSLDWVREPWE